MKRIYNTRNITLISLEENKLYQLGYKHCYVRKTGSQVYIYSYDTCILQLDYATNTIYNNKYKYSITTSKQKTQVLNDLHKDLIDWQVVDVIPNHSRNIWGHLAVSLRALV